MTRSSTTVDVQDIEPVTVEWATGDLEPHPKGEGYIVARIRLVLRDGTHRVELQGSVTDLREFVAQLEEVLDR